MDSNWLTANRGPVQKGPIHSVTIPGQVLRPLLVETRSAFSVDMHTRKNPPRRVMVHFRPPGKAWSRPSKWIYYYYFLFLWWMMIIIIIIIIIIVVAEFIICQAFQV